MSERILFEQVLIAIYVPTHLSAEQTTAVSATLRDRRFHDAFERAVKRVFESRPVLRRKRSWTGSSNRVALIGKRWRTMASAT
jgi:hypothetical protein